jgi:hypothetical protein
MMQGAGMGIGREIDGMKWSFKTKPSKSTSLWRKNSPLMILLAYAALVSGGCGQTAKPVVSPAAGQVDAYFGGPFSGNLLVRSLTTFDHSANQVGVDTFLLTSTALVPIATINGDFSPAATGFLGITENFAPNNIGIITAQNPPLTGAWAVEIPGAGALGNFLNVTSSGTTVTVRAAPAAMAENTVCPDFANLAPFLYVTVPTSTVTAVDTADYGGVTLSSQGSAITFRTQPYVIGAPAPTGFNVTGGCSLTNLGAVTAYPLNSLGAASNLELIAIGESGLLVSSFNAVGSTSSTGAFGGGTGVIGVAEPVGPVNVSAVVGAQYNGFLYDPQNTVGGSYDITTLASAYGDFSPTSSTCSALQSSLVANNGQGSGNIPALPSANSIYGGEFLTTTSNGSVNDPTGASGSENCDVVIDLGEQSSISSGIFPNATIFIGSNFPPYSISNPWSCSGGPCAVSFPAAAVVGQVQGQYVIFVVASPHSTPPAQLPNQFGGSPSQAIGIYLFQRSQ